MSAKSFYRQAIRVFTLIVIGVVLGVNLPAPLKEIVLKDKGRSETQRTENPPVPASAPGIYTVTRVTDGDTLTISDGHLRMKVRIAGIDAPESGQPFGKRAAQELKERVLDRQVQIVSVGSGLDPYNRILGQVLLDGKDVGLEMTRTGFVYYYRPRCVDYPENKSDYDYDPTPYINAEKAARAEKLQLWSGDAQEMPCAYRKTHKY